MKDTTKSRSISLTQYYYPGVYQADGFTTEFAVKELCCATLCEWATCTLLLSTSMLGLGGKGREERHATSGHTTAVDDQSDLGEKGAGQA